jgi:hypothetical protein
MTLSLLLIVVTAWLLADNAFAMLLAFLPMIYYHVNHLRPNAGRGLTQQSIDTVYYYGFLVTLGALAASVITVSFSGKTDNLQRVGLQFGLGLLATGYAVFARMHLMALNASSVDVDPDATMGHIVQKSRELVVNVEMATLQFDEYLKLQRAAIAKAEAEAISRIEDNTISASKSLESVIAHVFADAIGNLKQIKTILTDTTFSAETDRLKGNIVAVAKSLELLSESLDTWIQDFESGAKTSRDVNAQLSDLNQRLDVMNALAGKLSGTNGTLVSYSESIAVASTALSHHVQTLVPTVENLAEAATSLDEVLPMFKLLRTNAKKNAELLDALGEGSKKLNSVAERFAVSAEAVDALKESLAGVTGTLLGLTAQSDALNVCFDSAAKRANELSRSIEITTAATGSIGKLRSETASTIDQLASAVQQLALQNSELRVQLQRDLKVLGDIEAQRATTSAIYDILRQHTEVLSALTGSVSSAVAANRNGALKIEPTSIVSEPEKSISEV